MRPDKLMVSVENLIVIKNLKDNFVHFISFTVKFGILHFICSGISSMSLTQCYHYNGISTNYVTISFIKLIRLLDIFGQRHFILLLSLFVGKWHTSSKDRLKTRTVPNICPNMGNGVRYSHRHETGSRAQT